MRPHEYVTDHVIEQNSKTFWSKTSSEETVQSLSLATDLSADDVTLYGMDSVGHLVRNIKNNFSRDPSIGR